VGHQGSGYPVTSAPEAQPSRLAMLVRFPPRAPLTMPRLEEIILDLGVSGFEAFTPSRARSRDRRWPRTVSSPGVARLLGSILGDGADRLGPSPGPAAATGLVHRTRRRRVGRTRDRGHRRGPPRHCGPCWWNQAAWSTGLCPVCADPSLSACARLTCPRTNSGDRRLMMWSSCTKSGVADSP